MKFIDMPQGGLSSP